GVVQTPRGEGSISGIHSAEVIEGESGAAELPFERCRATRINCLKVGDSHNRRLAEDSRQNWIESKAERTFTVGDGCAGLDRNRPESPQASGVKPMEGMRSGP